MTVPMASRRSIWNEANWRLDVWDAASTSPSLATSMAPNNTAGSANTRTNPARVDLVGPYVSERGGGDDLLDGAVCGVVDEAGYD